MSQMRAAMPIRLRSFLMVPALLFSQACEQRTDQFETAKEASAETEAEPEGAVVLLVPGQGHYELARLDVGALAIALDTIEGEGAGTVVRLQIGNTTAAGLEDLSATLQWGALAPDSTPQTSPERTREVPLAAIVAAGKWTRTSFTLADVPPGALRFIRLSNIDFTGLILK